jgi:uncharacterized repeat protein (TIGR03803 family)
MLTRGSAFLTVFAFVFVVGCSNGPQSGYTPLNDARTRAHVNASVKQTVLRSFRATGAISALINVGNLLYGTTQHGGTSNNGRVFSIAQDGTGFTVLYNFAGKSDGARPAAGLINVGGTLYGTTEFGGSANNGTVFSITPAGALTTLYSFKGGPTDGARPETALTNVGGTLYGTTLGGGAVSGSTFCANCGTVFSISTSGQEKVLYFFGSTKGDGTTPQSSLVYAGGKLYGTTIGTLVHGSTGYGTIFSVTTAGKETVLHTFQNGSDGSCAANCHLTNVNGMLYGTAFDGGKNQSGSVFSITPAGAFKTLYSAPATGNPAGYPAAALTSVGGTLYGTMSVGPASKQGTVFSITTTGTIKTIYTFGGNDGATPASRLLLVGDVLFGTTAKGGTNNAGTIYSISGF